MPAEAWVHFSCYFSSCCYHGLHRAASQAAEFPSPPSWTSPPRPHLEAGPGFAGSSAQGHTRGRRRSGELVSCSLLSCVHICWTPSVCQRGECGGSQRARQIQQPAEVATPTPGRAGGWPHALHSHQPQPLAPLSAGQADPLTEHKLTHVIPKRSPPCSNNDSAWTRASGDSSLANRGLGRPQDSTEFCH